MRLTLVQRGSLALWFTDEAVEQWYPTVETRRGRECTYSDMEIHCLLIIRQSFSSAVSDDERRRALES
ncbi:MAG: transposase [Actinomycetota bacterium]